MSRSMGPRNAPILATPTTIPSGPAVNSPIMTSLINLQWLPPTIEPVTRVGYEIDFLFSEPADFFAHPDGFGGTLGNNNTVANTYPNVGPCPTPCPFPGSFQKA